MGIAAVLGAVIACLLNMIQIVLTLILSALSLTQTLKKDFALPPLDRRPEHIVHGELFTIKMTPGEGTTTFFLVGRRSIEVGLSENRIKIILPSGAKELRRVAPGKFIYDNEIKEDVKVLVVDPKGVPQETLQLDLP